jgi:hypothetical protein
MTIFTNTFFFIIFVCFFYTLQRYDYFSNSPIICRKKLYGSEKKEARADGSGFAESSGRIIGTSLCVPLRKLKTANITPCLAPCDSQFLAHLYRLDTLVDPRIAISQAFVVGYGLIDAQFRILHLVETLASHLCHPLLEGFCLFRRD